MVCGPQGGPDRQGLQRSTPSGPGANDVTVRMTEPGSEINILGSEMGMNLGHRANVTTGANTLISAPSYNGISVGNDSTVRADGNIISSGKNGAAIRAGERLDLVVGETAHIVNQAAYGNGIAASADSRIVVAGTVEVTATRQTSLATAGAGIDAGNGSHVIVTETGVVITRGAGQAGIAARRDTLVEVHGRINTYGNVVTTVINHAYGASASQGSTIRIGATGEINTYGTHAYGVALVGNVDPYSSEMLGTIDISGVVATHGANATGIRVSATTDPFGGGPPPGVWPQAHIFVREGALVSTDQAVGIAESTASARLREIDTTVRIAGELRTAPNFAAIYLAGGNDEVILEPTAIVRNPIFGSELAADGFTSINRRGEWDTFTLDGRAGTVGTFDPIADDGYEMLNGFEWFRKTGAGDWIIAGGPSKFWADGVVEQGRLFVDSAMPDLWLDVRSGALLGGGGTIGAIRAESGATVAPRPAGLAAAGPVALSPGSTFVVTSDGAGAVARLSGSRSVAIGGSALDVGIHTLDLAAASGATVISAAGGVTGQFASVSDDIVDVDVVPVYAPDSVSLALRLAAPGSAVSDKSIHADTVSALLEGELGFASQLLGRAGGSTGAGPTASISARLGRASHGMRAAPAGATPPSGPTVWIDGLVGGMSINGVDLSDGGLVGGVEHRDAVGGGPLTLGLAAGYGASRIESGTSSAEARIVRLGGYADWRSDTWSLAAAGAVGHADIDSARGVGGMLASGEADARLASASLVASYNLAGHLGLVEGTVVAPYATLDVAHVERDSFTETGAGPLGLTVAESDATRALAGIGLTLATRLPMQSGWVATPSLSVGYQRAFGDLETADDLAIAVVGGSFAQASMPTPRDRLKFGAGLSFESGDALSLSVRYDGATGSGYDSHAGKLGLSWKF